MKKVLKKMVGLLMAVMMIGSILVCSVSAVELGVASVKILAADADVRTEKPDLLLAKPKAAQRAKAAKKVRIRLKD